MHFQFLSFSSPGLQGYPVTAQTRVYRTEGSITYSSFTSAGLKVVGEVKKVGKSRNFHPKVGKSRNFSVFKVGKSRNFISVFVTSLHTGTSYMLVSFVDFEANHLFFQNCTFYTQSVAIEEPYLCTVDS